MRGKHGHKPIGYERICNGKLIRKVSVTGSHHLEQWRYVHRINWEEKNGPIQDGMVLACLGDRSDPSAENWKAVTPGIAAQLNMASDLDCPLRSVVVAKLLLVEKLIERLDADLMLLPRTREAARKQGKRWYFTNKPCPNGHLARRYTNCSVCVECNIERRHKVKPLTNSQRPEAWR